MPFHFVQGSVAFSERIVRVKIFFGKLAQTRVASTQKISERETNCLFLIFARLAQRVHESLIAIHIKKRRVNVAIDAQYEVLILKALLVRHRFSYLRPRPWREVPFFLRPFPKSACVLISVYSFP